MYEQVEKPKENKSRAVANSVKQKKSCGMEGFGVVDNRQNLAPKKVLSTYNGNMLKKHMIQRKIDTTEFTHTTEQDKLNRVIDKFMDTNKGIGPLKDENYTVRIETAPANGGLWASTESTGIDESTIQVGKYNAREPMERILETLSHEFVLHVMPEYAKPGHDRDNQTPGKENVTEHLPLIWYQLNPGYMNRLILTGTNLENEDSRNNYKDWLIKDINSHGDQVARYMDLAAPRYPMDAPWAINAVQIYDLVGGKYQLNDIGKDRLQNTIQYVNAQFELYA
ncbi:hypothetical protein [uncultured Shewanella sp.]|uniref:hypothetical protein n=1 Tax=uncultured Shewanella sp. TaxID=173975 RepID=UPI002621C020|nr:hypothetical protein [uncultured Shewanella sp.]